MVKQAHLIAVITILLAGLSSPPLYSQDGPRLSVEQPEFDFGTVYRGNLAKHTFSITNSGTEKLTISNVRSSCGCTVPSIAKRELAPGESTELTAIFDSGHFRGKVAKNIFVYSDDPVNAITKLSIYAEVQQDIEVAPASIYFAGLKAGESVQREIEIKNLSGSEVNIKEISSTVSSVEIQLEKTVLKPDESTLLHLRIPKVEKGMKLTGELTIFNTSHEDELKIRLYGGIIQ